MTMPQVKKITTNIRIPEPLHEQVASYAAQAGLSMNLATIAVIERGLRDLGFPGLVIDPTFNPARSTDQV